MENELLGFEYQPDFEGSCGAYSLGHTLNLVGIPNIVDETKMACRFVSNTGAIKKKIEKILGGDWGEINLSIDSGTEESGIKRGLKKFGCDPIYLSTESSREAKVFIDKNLLLGNPIILMVNYDYDADDTGHWLVCGGKLKNKYIVVDSSPIDGAEKIDIYSWDELEERFIWFEEDDDEYYQFDIIAASSSTSPSCVKQMGEVFETLYEDEDLQEWWGYYLNDLLDVCEYDFGIRKDYIQISDLVIENKKSICELLSYWFDEIDEYDLNYEVDNYIVVAKAYRLAVPKAQKEKALISFSSALAGTLIY